MHRFASPGSPRQVLSALRQRIPSDRSLAVRHLLPFLLLVSFSGTPHQQELAPPQVPGVQGVDGVVLRPTAHAELSTNLTDLWLGPVANTTRPAVGGSRAANLAAAAEQLREKHYAQAIPLLRPEHFPGSILADYATYYTGVAQFGLGQLTEARATFAELRGRSPQGYLSEATLLREGEVAEEQREYDAAIALYELALERKPTEPDVVLFHLARAAAKAGDRDRAVKAYRNIYFRFPQSNYTLTVEDELARLGNPQPSGDSHGDFELNLGRAERLFGAKDYIDARRAFDALKRHASGDQKELVSIRLGECDYYLKRYNSSARIHLEPYLSRGARQAEARFFYLTATRELNGFGEFVTRTRQLVQEFPDSSWAEEALNNLATHYIVQDQDAEAMVVFRELVNRFPNGSRTERAAWKLGWWSYENGALEDSIRVFEQTAGAFPRSDTRPAFLYWAARAHEKLGSREAAAARYAIVRADYQNSYYGRLAVERLQRLGPVAVPVVAELESATPVPAGLDASGTGFQFTPDAAIPDVTSAPTEPLIRLLLSLELYEDAENELKYLQRSVGDSPAIQATMAWIHNQRGDLRRGINVMKRAYPQYLAAGGEKMPSELLKVLFPLDYWDLIKRHATAQGLDPYLVAALVAQESTFMPAVKSPANAYGLMQVVPATGRRIARSIKMPKFSTSTLTNPEANVRIGTTYFARLSAQLGGTHLALASYNAGDSRVIRWRNEKPHLERDEFIDSIPFPETQNYVKKILGTADDYRRLYGDRGVSPDAGRPETSAAASKASAKSSKSVSSKRSTAKKSSARKPATRKRAPAAKPSARK